MASPSEPLMKGIRAAYVVRTNKRRLIIITKYFSKYCYFIVVTNSNRARTPTSSAPHVAPCPPPSLTAALPLEGIDPRPGHEGTLLQLQVDHAPPRRPVE